MRSLITDPSASKKAFKELMSIPIDLAGIGKSTITEISSGKPMTKKTILRARLVMSISFLDGTEEIRATVSKENLDFWQRRHVGELSMRSTIYLLSAIRYTIFSFKAMKLGNLFS